MGLVIRRDQFPDRLFAPAKRTDLLPDGANPVYDKEMGAEIFSQGTLMLRVVIQVSMFLAIPLMAFCLYIKPELAPWYVSYVVLFNMLVGPVFSAGSITSERERETLELLLTTIITPQQILWGKLISGLRVSSVLTMFLLWPLLLGLPDGLRLLAEPADAGGLRAAGADHLPDDRDAGLVLLDALPQDVGEPDDQLPVGRRAFRGAAGHGRVSPRRFSPTLPGRDSSSKTTFVSPVAAAFALPLILDRPEVDNRVGRPETFIYFVLFYGVLERAAAEHDELAVQHALARGVLNAQEKSLLALQRQEASLHKPQS